MNAIDIQKSQREKQFVAASSVAAAVLLTGMKIVVGYFTGSLGIIAEAAHSGLDLIAAIITLLAVRVSDRAPDAAHHYGHGKIENLSALAETFLLFITCGWIIYEAGERLFFHPRSIDPSLWAFATMGISVVVDFSRSRALSRVAKKYHSQALEADALHFQTDIWSSLVVIVGLALVFAGNHSAYKAWFIRADAIAALAVAVIVIWVSWKLGRRTVDALLDAAPEGITERIIATAEQIPGVCRVLRTRVRGSGAHLFIELRVAVPRHYSLQNSHQVTGRVEHAIRIVAPGADLVVDTMPSAENENVLERIRAVADYGHFAIHHITTHHTQRGLYIDLDLEVEPSLSFEQAHAQSSELEKELIAEFGTLADINVHIEPRDKETLAAVELPVEHARQYTERLTEILREFPAVHDCQDVRVQRMRCGIYLSFHALMNADQTVTAVHQIAEDLESRLRHELPDLCRVVIHTEPFKTDAV